MQFKIDTKEKFHVVTLNEQHITANIAADLEKLVMEKSDGEIKNVILRLGDVAEIDEAAAVELTRIQQKFYEKNASFVICELQPQVEKYLDEIELLEIMNITPTESEAWDIVQMEEIERELMDSDDMEFTSMDDE